MTAVESVNLVQLQCARIVDIVRIAWRFCALDVKVTASLVQPFVNFVKIVNIA